MSKVTPVSRLLSPLSWALAVVLLLMAAVAMGGVLLSNRALNQLSGELEPASDANSAILNDMVNMETGLRAYTQSGLKESLAPYDDAQLSLAQHQRVVRAYAARDAEMNELVRQQDLAIDNWLRNFARKIADRDPSLNKYDPAEWDPGDQMFAQVRSAYQQTSALFNDRVAAAKDKAEKRLRTTLIATGLLALLGALVLYRVRERVVEEVAKPLIRLDAVVDRLAAGEHSARAQEGVGPAEIQSVSLSLNHLAEANERARAVEKHISEELLHLDMARADFMSNVSHELRTPLTTIAGYLELVAEEFEGRLGERHQRMLDAADRNVDRLSGLIDDLLALTRAETSPIEQVEPTDVATLVRHVVADQAMTAARRQVSIEVTSSEGNTVLADPAMLSRVFVNVLSNAVKFSHKGGDVEVAVDHNDEDVVVTVTDHGIGIPANELSKIGGRFFRASNAITGKVSGTGLGLRIGQTVVEKHSGALRVDSTEGEGTVVTVTLPLHHRGAARDSDKAATTLEVRPADAGESSSEA